MQTSITSTYEYPQNFTNQNFATQSALSFKMYQALFPEVKGATSRTNKSLRHTTFNNLDSHSCSNVYTYHPIQIQFNLVMLIIQSSNYTSAYSVTVTSETTYKNHN